MKHFDLAIIGAGVVGCSIAYALSKRGISTLNIDALPAAGYGSTSASSAIVRPMYSHVVSAAVAHEARSCWLKWREFVNAEIEEPVAEYRETGGLVLVKGGELEHSEKMLNAMAEVGVTFEVVGAAKLGALFPGISLSSYGPARPMTDDGFGLPTEGKISHGILVKECGYVSDPQLAARNLCDAAIRLGGAFQFNSKVSEIKPYSDGFELVTNNGTIFASKLLNAAGPHSARTNQLAGTDIPIDTRPLRHEVSYLSQSISHFEKAAMLILDTDAGVYQRPEGTADMLIGTTDPECDLEDLVDPDLVDTNLTDKWTRQVVRAAQRFPDYQIPNQARGTVGVYDVSTDWIPIYDCTDQPGYYVAIGTSGNQFKNAPLIGEIMAQIICADEHDKNPAKLQLESLNREVDLSFFSRNREVQATRGVLA